MYIPYIPEGVATTGQSGSVLEIPPFLSFLRSALLLNKTEKKTNSYTYNVHTGICICVVWYMYMCSAFHFINYQRVVHIHIHVHVYAQCIVYFIALITSVYFFSSDVNCSGRD